MRVRIRIRIRSKRMVSFPRSRLKQPSWPKPNIDTDTVGEFRRRPISRTLGKLGPPGGQNPRYRATQANSPTVSVTARTPTKESSPRAAWWIPLASASSRHSGGVNVAMADGSVRFVKDTVSSWALAADGLPEGLSRNAPLYFTGDLGAAEPGVWQALFDPRRRRSAQRRFVLKPARTLAGHGGAQDRVVNELRRPCRQDRDVKVASPA